MKKKLLLAVLFSAALSLAACGNTAEAPKDEDVVTEADADSKEVPEDDKDEKKEEEPEKEPEEVVVLPYFEENGIALSTEQTISTPCFFYVTSSQVSGEYIPVDGYTTDSAVMEQVIRDIEVTDSYEEGYVDVTFAIDLSLQSAKAYFDPASGDANTMIYMNFIYGSFALCDYYTGLEFPTKSLRGDDESMITTTVTWNDVDYEVSYSVEQSWESWGGNGWQMQDDGSYIGEWTDKGTRTYSIHMPKDYDGLVIETIKEGKSEETYKPLTDDVTENHLLLDPSSDGTQYKADDFICIRLSDLL